MLYTRKSCIRILFSFLILNKVKNCIQPLNLSVFDSFSDSHFAVVSCYCKGKKELERRDAFPHKYRDCCCGISNANYKTDFAF